MELCNTNNHLPEKSIFSLYFSQINPYFMPTVRTIYMIANNLQGPLSLQVEYFLTVRSMKVRRVRINILLSVTV